MNLLPESVFETQIDEMLDLLRRFVKVESPSWNKPALDAMGATIVAALQGLSPEIAVDRQTETGDHVVAHWPGPDGKSAGGVVLLCHFDTVHDVGELAINPIRLEDGMFYGPGAFDMKASIVEVIFALRTLQVHGRWPALPVTVLFTSDEEVGSRHSRALIERHCQDASLALCMEPGLSGGEVKTWRKGVGDFEMVVHGKPSHAGAAHNEGVNALEEAAHQILALQALTDYDRGTTVNVGMVWGGTRPNVVPDRCEMKINVRVMTMEEGRHLTSLIHGVKPKNPATRLEITGEVQRPPMIRTEYVVRTLAFAQMVGRELGQVFGEGGTGGGSDINWVSHLPIGLLDGMGPTGVGAHTHHEAVSVASLVSRTALLAGMLSAWPGRQSDNGQRDWVI